MNIKNISISEDILLKYPGIKFGYLIAKNVLIQKENAELEAIKKEVEKEVRQNGIGNYKEDKNIKAWFDVFTNMGIDYDKFPPAQYALIKRVAMGGNIPKINTIVDIANIMALKSRLPVGAFNIDKVKNEITLRLSKIGEIFHPLCSSVHEKICSNEIVYADSEKVFSRYTKDCDETKITDKIKSVLFVIDGTKENQNGEIFAYLNMLEELLKEVCNAHITEKNVISK